MFDNNDSGSDGYEVAQTMDTSRLIARLQPRFFLQVLGIHECLLKAVSALKNEAQQKGVSVNSNAILSIWQKYLRRVNTLFRRYFRLVDRAAKSEHGVGTAYELTKSIYDTEQKKFYFQVEGHTNGKVIPLLAELSGKTQ
jgi:hypothetical protein